ncbi:MAG: transposase [Parcubacteria group bacterium Gr01-1014_48]|nr:MAG: transposase [Parcubacteria group bacterium Gr01-1014_48]
MTSRSLTRYEVIRKLLDGYINGTEAAKQLSLSLRHIKRLKVGVYDKGAPALIHGNRGKQSNRHLDTKVEKRALDLIKQHYADFTPTLATEKLKEQHNIVLSIETVRKRMITEKLWKPRERKQNKQYHHWRPRKEHEGEMQQFDGSYHRWFEDRGEESCLLAAIDDATGKITKAVFADNEGVDNVFRFWKGYVETHGKPVSIYLDKFSTYKINHPSAVDNSELLTQFQRAAQELDIRLITAHSPQAKGRVERLFGTLQDRLVKELRLRGISDKETANRFLAETFIPWFNERFAVTPAKRGDVHRQLNQQEKEELDSIFSVQSSRQVGNDFTIRFKNQWLQLEEKQSVTVCKKDDVLVEERLDQSIQLRSLRRGKYLLYRALPERPQRTVKTPVLSTTTGTKSPWIPPANHPWRNDGKRMKSGKQIKNEAQICVE